MALFKMFVAIIGDPSQDQRHLNYENMEQFRGVAQICVRNRVENKTHLQDEINLFDK